MRKRICAILLASMLAVTLFGVRIHGETDMEVPHKEYSVYLGEYLLENKAFPKGDTIMLPLREFFEKLNFDVSIDNHAVMILSYDIYVYAKHGCRIAFVNAVPFGLSTQVEIINDVYYMPIDLPGQMLGMPVEIDEEKNSISITPVFDIIEEENLELLFPPSPVYGTIKSGSGLYDNKAGKYLGYCREDTRAEIIRDSSLMWYKVRIDGRREYWVKRESLVIDTEYVVRKDIPSREELELYAVLKQFKSETSYFIWVDISRQMAYLFRKEGKAWILQRMMKCCTGKNESPTIRGLFKTADRGDWFYTPLYGRGGKYWVRFHDVYLLHSISMDINKRIIDTTLGDRVTAGCIRLSVQDSMWLYNNIPERTAVFVN